MRDVQKCKLIPPMPPLFKRVGIYCRVSTGLVEQLYSLSAQASAYVQQFATRLDHRVVDIYIDVCTGESQYRREFNRMLEDANNNKLDVVITKSVSRFGRNTEDTLIALRQLKANNVQVIFEQENLDTFNSSELMISILSSYAQSENESRRQNQLWAIRKRVEDGTSELYMRKCYGYYKDAEGRLIIEPLEGEVVQMIYSSYLNGMSIVGIQKKLKESNIKTSKGKEIWSKKSIENILTNEKYTGDVIVMKTKTSPEKGHKRVENTDGNKYMIQDLIPSIITKEIFNQVQAERERRTNIVTDQSGTHRKETKYSSKK